MPLLVFSFLLSSTVAASKIFEKIKHEIIATWEKKIGKGVRTGRGRRAGGEKERGEGEKERRREGEKGGEEGVLKIP